MIGAKFAGKGRGHHNGRVRWDSLFADLDAQAAALAVAERAAEIDERTRIETGTIALAERLTQAVGLPLTVRLPGMLLRGSVERVGPDWLLLAEDGGGEIVVALRHLLAVRGAPRFAAGSRSDGVVADRLTMRHALRGIARDRSPVRVLVVDGSLADGTVDRIGGDYVELAAHAAGELRRSGEVRELELIPLRAVVAVRRRL